MSTPDDAASGVVAVEAPTAELALQRVSARYGAQAEILSASRVLRGGIAGFFAKEMIELRVRTGAGEEAAGARGAARSEGRAAVSGSGPGVGAVSGSGPGVGAASVGGVATALGGGAAAPEVGGPGASERAPAVPRLLPEADEPAASERAPAVARLLSTLTGKVDDRERTFGEALRTQLAKQGHLAAAEGQAAAADTAAQPPGSEPAAEGQAAAADAAAQPLVSEPAAAGLAAQASEPATTAAGLAAQASEPESGTAPAPVPVPVPAEAVAGAVGTIGEGTEDAVAHDRNESAVRDERSAARQPLAPAPVAMGPARGLALKAGATAPASAARQQPGGPELGGSPAPKAVSPGRKGSLARRAWQDEAVERLGLPQTVRDAIAGIDDDMACLQAVASAVATLCRPLPAGVPLLVGPEAGTLSPALDVPLVLPPGPAPAQGPVAAAVGGTELEWVERVRGHRWVHLVVGGPGWAGLAGTGPLAVSWAEAADLPAALRLAAGDGLVLGFDGTRAARRASPVDVAVALREMVVER